MTGPVFPSPITPFPFEPRTPVPGGGYATKLYVDALERRLRSEIHPWPENGIPKDDLDASVRASLAKADTALQELPDDIPAAKITGVLADSQVPSIAASKITGVLTDSQVPSIAASKITGVLADSQVPSLAAGKITSGTFAADRIPSLAAGKITSGTFAADRIPSLAAGKITSGTFASARLPLATSSAKGAVMPVAKTDDMTQNVGMGTDGKLYTAPGGGGGGGGSERGYTISLCDYDYGILMYGDSITVTHVDGSKETYDGSYWRKIYTDVKSIRINATVSWVDQPRCDNIIGYVDEHGGMGKYNIWMNNTSHKLYAGPSGPGIDSEPDNQYAKTKITDVSQVNGIELYPTSDMALFFQWEP